MTDDEIIKALNEADGLNEVSIYCADSKGENPSAIKMTDIVDFINRQTAENERLQKHNSVVAHKHFNDGIKYLAEKIYQKIGSEKNKHYETISERVERFGADRYEDLFCSVCDGKILALDEIQFFIEDFVKEEAGEE